MDSFRASRHRVRKNSCTAPRFFFRNFGFVFACFLVLKEASVSVSGFTSPSLTCSQCKRTISIRSGVDVNVNSPHQPRHHNRISFNLYSMTADEEATDTEEAPLKPANRKRDFLKIIGNVYIKYITKLWKETQPREREKVAAQQALAAIRRVQHIMEGEEYVDMSYNIEGETLDDIGERIEARDGLKIACDKMLLVLEKQNMPAPAMEIAASEKEVAKAAKKAAAAAGGEKKKSRSVLFGATMGAIVALWVFSGNFLFTAAFTLMTALGQLEYYRMVMKTGVYPARRISVVGACSMFLTVSN